MKSISDYSNPFDAVEEFEQALSEFTGAKGVVATDSCTHAIELGLRYQKPKLYATLPNRTYISVPMTLAKLEIDYLYDDEETWDRQYQIKGSIVYDAARDFREGMFEDSPGQTKIVCLSFGHGKPLELGHGGAILTNSKKAYDWIKRASYDGRDPNKMNWHDQKEFNMGYHYHMRPEDAVIGLNKLANGEINDLGDKGYEYYPDLRNIKINT